MVVPTATANNGGLGIFSSACDIKAIICWLNEEGILMRIRHLLVPLLLVSACVAQRLPGNVQKLYKKNYLCIETEPLAAPPERVKKLFPGPVLFQQLPTTGFRQDGSILTRIIPPPEFRPMRDLTIVDMSGVSMFLPGRFLCRDRY
jgi:hypothetical protein